MSRDRAQGQRAWVMVAGNTHDVGSRSRRGGADRGGRCRGRGRGQGADGRLGARQGRGGHARGGRAFLNDRQPWCSNSLSHFVKGFSFEK